MHGSCVRAASQGGLSSPRDSSPSLLPAMPASRPGAELLVGTWCWKKPVGLQACQERDVKSVAISSGWVIIRNEDSSGHRRRP